MLGSFLLYFVISIGFTLFYSAKYVITGKIFAKIAIILVYAGVIVLFIFKPIISWMLIGIAISLLVGITIYVIKFDSSDSYSIDFEKLKIDGIGDGISIKALIVSFDDKDELNDCLPGYDCNCVIVLDDGMIAENRTYRNSENIITLNDLLPIRWQKNFGKYGI